MFKLIYYLVIFLIISVSHLAHIFCCNSNITNFFDTESVLISELENYINQREDSLLFLRKTLHKYQTEHKEALNDSETYLSNPMNIFFLVKRLTTDLKRLEEVANPSPDFFQKIANLKNSSAYPTERYLPEAAIALIVMQEKLAIRPFSLASGVVNGVQYSNTEMTAEDCFELGRQIYEAKRCCYYHAVSWFDEALDRLANEEIPSVPKVDILEYLALSHHYTDVELALQMTNELLKLEPEHKRALKNKIQYEEKLQYSINSIYTNTNAAGYEASVSPRPFGSGESKVSSENLFNLFCKYVTPFIKIAPFKIEEISLDPFVIMLHEVLSDKEILVINQELYNYYENRFQNGRLATVQCHMNDVTLGGWHIFCTELDKKSGKPVI